MLFTLGDQQSCVCYLNWCFIFPCCQRGFLVLVASCSEVSGIKYDSEILWIWILCQIWHRDIIWHWRDLECAVCDRGYFSILLFTVFSCQDYSPFPVNFFIELCRNVVLNLFTLKLFYCSLLPWLVCIFKDTEDRLLGMFYVWLFYI